MPQNQVSTHNKCEQSPDNEKIKGKAICIIGKTLSPRSTENLYDHSC